MSATKSVRLVLLFLAAAAGSTAAYAVETGGDAYQTTLIDSALRAKGLSIETAPAGKRIERVEIVPYDVFLSNEGWPLWFNWFHATTGESVVRRELLFKEGDRWNEDLVLESARNLRDYLFVGVARVVPCRGSRPDSVVVLVVAKDLWSLRLNSNFSYVGSNLELLQLQLAETNVAGRNKRATIDFGLDLATLHGGFQYVDPRVLGSNIVSQSAATVYWNRASGVAEGVVSNLRIEKPLYNLDTQWGWKLSADYINNYYRFFSGGQVAPVKSRLTGESLPYFFKRDRLEAVASVTRSYGRARKSNATFGYRTVLREYKLPAGPAISAAGVADISASILPYSERAGMLFGRYDYYRADFRQLLDINSFAVTEDFRLGPALSSEVRWASRALGFNSAFVQLALDASWSHLMADDLMTVAGSVATRHQAQAGAGVPWVNNSWSLLARNVSPAFGFLRLHTQTQIIRRTQNLENTFETLGGDTNLRGYPSGYLRGANQWSANFELRTKPVEFWGFYWGLATFVDLGDANDDWRQITVHASGGAGLRVLLPQFDRSVIRADFGLPFEAIATGYTPAYFVVQYQQAFGPTF